MPIPIELTFNELNALNKLLGRVKTEAYLDADEINFFALSPFIISSFEKIHKEYMAHIRHQIATGKSQPMRGLDNVDSSNEFNLTDNSYTGEIKTRLLNFSDLLQEHIRKLSKNEREEFCDLIFAPFKPNLNQRQKIIDVLKFIADTTKK